MPFNTNTDIWFAGAFAAFSVDLLVYPLDTLKTRIQSPNYNTLYKNTPQLAAPASASSSSSSSSSPFASSVSSPRERPTHLTTSSLLSRHTHFNPTLFRGLYQGIGTVIFVTIPSSGAFFTTYEALKHNLSDAIPPNSTLYLPQPAINSISSGGAELVSCAVLTPAEVLKQNAQVFNQRKDKTGQKGSSPTLEVVRQFRRHPTKLFRGYTTLAARNLPFTGLQFPIFEHLKAYFLDRRKSRMLQNKGAQTEVGGKAEGEGMAEVGGIFERARITALSAALAGTGAAWVTTPIDVVKTRIMLGAGDEAKNRRPHAPEAGKEVAGRSAVGKNGAVDVVRQILRSEGIRGMFRGAMLRSLWTAFGSGLYLGCYEGGRHYLEERRRNQDEGGDVVMEKEASWKKTKKVGVGSSRSQGDSLKKSAWQE